jgi:hypothetical protein
MAFMTAPIIITRRREQNHGRGQANEGKERRMPVKEVPSLALLVHQLIRLTQEVGFLDAEPT